MCTRHKYIMFKTLITQLDDFILTHCQLLLRLGDYSVCWSNFLVVLFVRLEIFRQANGLEYFFQLSIEIVLIPALAFSFSHVIFSCGNL